MDYGKLTKAQLVELCEERGISFSSTWTKDKLIDTLISNESSNAPVQKNKTKEVQENDDSTFKFDNGGALINIILGSVLLVAFLALTILFFFLFEFIYYFVSVAFLILTIGAIWSIISNVNFRRYGTMKKAAAATGLLYGLIIGGVMLYISKDKEPMTDEEILSAKIEKYVEKNSASDNVETYVKREIKTKTMITLSAITMVTALVMCVVLLAFGTIIILNVIINDTENLLTSIISFIVAILAFYTFILSAINISFILKYRNEMISDKKLATVCKLNFITVYGPIFAKSLVDEQ